VKKTRVAVFLVSPDSLASDFINDEELGPLVAAKEAGEVTIVWVQLSACAFDQTPLAGIQSVVSPPGKPVADLSKSKRDAAWLAVSHEVKKALGGGDAD
jgi:internalin A